MKSGTYARTLLTKSEIRVLEVIARGISSQDAADEIGVSKRTIDFHLNGIYRKLGVANRIQAIFAAQSRRLIKRRIGGK